MPAAHSWRAWTRVLSEARQNSESTGVCSVKRCTAHACWTPQKPGESCAGALPDKTIATPYYTLTLMRYLRDRQVHAQHVIYRFASSTPGIGGPWV